MEITLILIPMALLLAIFFIASFIWMTKKGQYDDLETPRHRILLDDYINNNTKTKIITKTKTKTPEGEL